MPVNLPPIEPLRPIKGIEVGASQANIRYRDRLDLAVFRCEPGSIAGGVFTKSSYRAAPVLVAERHMGEVRGMVVNSGNANAATGDQGLADAVGMCDLLGNEIDCTKDKILPFSTGVIGELLPMDRMAAGIEEACQSLSPNGWNAAAQAIMTTDTAPKGASTTFNLRGSTVTATAIVKGSGMIRPDMATMLAFLGTDAGFSASVATQLAKDLAERSFNRITVDGDTSTNDSFVVVGTNQAESPKIESTTGAGYNELLKGLSPLVEDLAQGLVRDGEGATKFVTIHVKGGRTERECLNVAYTVGNSPLVKTAFFAGDPNWGRFCMAIGRAGIEDLDPNQVSLHLDSVGIAKNGQIDPDYVEEQAAEVMGQDEYVVLIDLGRGNAEARVWTSDLSYDYVKINAEYRT